MDTDRLVSGGKYAAGVIAGIISAWAFSGNAKHADPMIASYEQHGYPGCLTLGELNAHVADVEQSAQISGREARAEIATLIDRGVPPSSWTRFALYTDALKNWDGPAAEPCADRTRLLEGAVSRK